MVEVMDAAELDVKAQVCVEEQVRPGKSVFYVYGPIGSGKSTFAGMLAERMTEKKVTETSDYLIEELVAHMSCYLPLFDPEAYRSYLKKKDILARRQLTAFGNLMTRLKPDVLIEGAAKKGTIIVGPRRICEMEHWFYGVGFRNEAAVLVEIHDSQKVDPCYELQGWKRPEDDKRRFVVPGVLREKWDKIADNIVGYVRDYYSEI